MLIQNLNLKLVDLRDFISYFEKKIKLRHIKFIRIAHIEAESFNLREDQNFLSGLPSVPDSVIQCHCFCGMKNVAGKLEEQ